MRVLSETQDRTALNGAKFCKKGDWVEIHNVILDANHRSKDIPLDTALVPLESWVRGWALTDAVYGQEITAETPAGRTVQGTLVAVNPGYEHTYGPAVSELAFIGKELRKILADGGGGNHDN